MVCLKKFCCPEWYIMGVKNVCVCVAGHLDRKSRLSWEIAEVPLTEIQLHHGRVKEISPIFTVLAVLGFLVSVGRRAKSSAFFVFCYILGVAMDIPIPKIRSRESSFTFAPASVKKTKIRSPKTPPVFYVPPSQATPKKSTKGNLLCVDFVHPSVCGGWYQGFFLSPP